MNTAHTPQALSLPHLQIAEVSARRQDENDAFERAAAQLRPAWMRVEARVDKRDAQPVPAAGALGKALRRDAIARADAEADQYRRRLLGDLARSHRNLRHLFIAAFVAACGVLALTESRPAAQASRAEPRVQPRVLTTQTPAAPAPSAAPTATIATPSTDEAPAEKVEPAATQPAQPVPARANAAQPAWKQQPASKQPAWKARAAAAPARWQPKPAAIKHPAIAPKRVPAQPLRAQPKPAAR